MRPSKTARNVIISGLTASGKTTHAKLLAQEYGLEYISASQILLKMAGLTTQQPLDFWVTPQGLQLSKQAPWSEVDEQFCRMEATYNEAIFDCLSLPWLHTKKCMVIWLESSLESRLMKAIVSHNGENNLSPAEVEKRIRTKDRVARHKIFEQYGVDIFRNRSPFDLIIDVSSLITAPTQNAASLGIQMAHEIMSSAVGWYLYEDKSCWKQLQASLALYGTQVIMRYPKKALATSRKGRFSNFFMTNVIPRSDICCREK